MSFKHGIPLAFFTDIWRLFCIFINRGKYFRTLPREEKGQATKNIA